MPDLDARAALSGTRFTDVRWFAEVASTNGLAADLARAGAADGTVVGAEHQTAGRGRRGRAWTSEPGSSLLVSVVRRPVPPLLTLAAGVAAAGACRVVAGVETTLKWPNDVFVAGGKVGGILSELVGDAAVVGLGLNVDWRSALPPGAAALGPGVERAGLLVAWLTGLDDVTGLDAADVLDRYRSLCSTVGRRVRVELPGETVAGLAEGVDDDGSLVVDGRRITAGDVVHLR
ncbi:MAG: biotin--[acetyl-CoA-carboxylase] ligase [Actinomycetota bacterium]|nr:biotin--[acetyl-CoA-carboxylase] ligase [Actinomycetota bacterium]